LPTARHAAWSEIDSWWFLCSDCKAGAWFFQATNLPARGPFACITYTVPHRNI
jgi:hypothetical protein